VATGGGVVTTTANWGELQQGVVIWLDVAEELLLARLQADPTPRPLLNRLPQLLEERRPLYGQADLQVNAGCGGPETVVAQILEGLPPLLKARSAPQTTAP
jgi:shikimate kinase